MELIPFPTFPRISTDGEGQAGVPIFMAAIIVCISPITELSTQMSHFVQL